MKTKTKQILFFLLVVAILGIMGLTTIALNSHASTQTQPQPTETQREKWLKMRNASLEFLKKTGGIPIPDSLKKEYENWIKDAEGSADNGNVPYMEAYLTRAKWCMEDADTPEGVRAVTLKDFSERAEAIRLKGYENAASDELTSALSCAHSNNESGTRRYLKNFRTHSLKAGLEPDGKVRKVRKILTATLAERKKLEN